MIWFAIILACVVAIVVGVYTRDLKKTLRVGIITLIAGTFLSLLIVYSGVMGG